MKSQRIIRTGVAFLALTLFSVSQARAQAPGTGPIAPVGPIVPRQAPVPTASGLGLEQSPIDARPQADTHTLSSIEMLGLGSLSAIHSFLDPSFRINQSLDTGIVPGTKNSVTSLGVNLMFDRNGARSRLTGMYGGAHVFYHPDSVYDTTYHNLGLSQEVRWARWGLRLRDDLLIAPEAPFGGLDTGGANLQAATQAAVGGADTILTQRAKRVNNTAAGEINYSMSRRSVMTFAGSYTVLDFSNAGYIDSHGGTARVGYDYALSAKNAVGFMYNYTRTAFSLGFPVMQTDMVQLSLGRKVTGRMALQISAGPQLLRTASLSNSVHWNLSTGMTYQMRRALYSLSYTHGIASGSGVFVGAETHTVASGLHYSLTQAWAVSAAGGYAFNRALAPVAGVADSFGNWYGTAAIEREIGRHFHFGLNYGYQEQNAGGGGVCPVAACGGTTPSRQLVGATVEWHPWLRAR